jgi:hypothetical protein
MRVPRPVDVKATPEISRLAHEVAQSGVPVLLKDDGEELAILMPASKSRQRSGLPDPSAATGDSLLNIIGIGESHEPTDVARHKHEYLAEAYEVAGRSNP